MTADDLCRLRKKGNLSSSHWANNLLSIIHPGPKSIKRSRFLSETYPSAAAAACPKWVSLWRWLSLLGRAQQEHCTRKWEPAACCPAKSGGETCSCRLRSLAGDDVNLSRIRTRVMTEHEQNILSCTNYSPEHSAHRRMGMFQDFYYQVGCIQIRENMISWGCLTWQRGIKTCWLIELSLAAFRRERCGAIRSRMNPQCCVRESVWPLTRTPEKTEKRRRT